MIDDNENIFRSGFAAVVGKPNVGKSTLVNRLVGQKIAAVSSKPQTTRLKQLGILTREDAQIIFIDTPGIHIPRNKLGKGMNNLAEESLEEADVVVWIVDVSQDPDEEDELITGRLGELKKIPPVVQTLNKSDLVGEDEKIDRAKKYGDLYPGVEQVFTSATAGEGLDTLINRIKENLPAGYPFYPEGQITDYYEREIAAGLIREAALENLREEVPHAIAVRVDEYKERNEKGAYIAATIFVEKNSQKGIVIGSGGQMLKMIGIRARRAIEAMSGRKVYLELRVKVKKNWRSDADFLRRIGYEKLEES